MIEPSTNFHELGSDISSSMFHEYKGNNRSSLSPLNRLVANPDPNLRLRGNRVNIQRIAGENSSSHNILPKFDRLATRNKKEQNFSKSNNKTSTDSIGFLTE